MSRGVISLLRVAVILRLGSRRRPPGRLGTSGTLSAAMNDRQKRRGFKLSDIMYRCWSNSCTFALTFDTIDENVRFPAVQHT